MPKKIAIKTFLIVFTYIFAASFLLGSVPNTFFFPILVLILFISAGLLYVFVPQLSFWLLKKKWRNRKKQTAVLTFDDGPDAETTPLILDILKREDIRATFFVLGAKARTHQDIIRRMKLERHEIGNHTTKHKKVFLRDLREVTYDIIDASNSVAQTTGTPPAFFRAPHGFRTLGLRKILKRLGLTNVAWTKGIWDTDNSSHEEMMRRFAKKFSNLEILLLHDGIDPELKEKRKLACTEILPSIISLYREMGYEFHTVSEI